ncbi:MAG TPA: IS110 family transposase [Burkholderiales bacterium]|nr:IS110 family transposase [Burkholderiales bacterium]
MEKITTVGLDLAKQVFQLHCADERGHVVARRAIRRERLLDSFAQLPRCLVGMEACSGAHHWARELSKLGHEVRIMAAGFVRPFRKSVSAKNDANDAEAICTAVRQANMRFVSVKTIEQQAWLSLHRIRQGYMEERTATINRLRGLLAEFGMVVPQSPEVLKRAWPAISAAVEQAVPGNLQRCLNDLHRHISTLEQNIQTIDHELAQHAKNNQAARRLAAITGIGPLTASAAVASISNARDYRNGRQFAASLGIVPRQYSSGGKRRLGGITHRGDAYLRTLLIQGARSALQSALRRAPTKHDRLSAWIVQLAQRVGYHKTLVAIANKHARIIWVLLAHGQSFQRNAAIAA